MPLIAPTAATQNFVDKLDMARTGLQDLPAVTSASVYNDDPVATTIRDARAFVQSAVDEAGDTPSDAVAIARDAVTFIPTAVGSRPTWLEGGPTVVEAQVGNFSHDISRALRLIGWE